MQRERTVEPDFQESVTTWEAFRQRWGGLHNFLLAGEITAGFNYSLPPLERIIEEVRSAPGSIMRSGVKGDAFDLTDIKPAFCRLPLAEAMRSRFVLAHFKLHPELTGKGQVFEGLEEAWVEPWRQTLRAHGFTFNHIFAIVFASGPQSASNYHMDYTHQLAWQRYGTKHFSGLKDPDRWTTPELRGGAELKDFVKPSGLGAEDVYTIVQPPDSVLWNAHTTPHWVETHEDCAATLTLVHDGLCMDGKLCPHAVARAQWRKEHNLGSQSPQYAVKAT